MKLFFSCDWGTSNFRLRLVDAENATVLSEIKTAHGIAAAFQLWKQSGKSENGRIAFYQGYVYEQIKKISASFNKPIDNASIILSGMASSSMGMLELPYKELPFRCDGSDLIVRTINEGKGQQYKMTIISGARSEVDAMRGEETMLAGCDIPENETPQLFIFPGTHSKHVTVKNGLTKSIATYMTGELFNLLAGKSILSESVKKNDPEDNSDNSLFSKGVIKGVSSNILNSIFLVRTNHLFKRTTAEQNYHYLSGLLIGQELKDITGNKPAIVNLVCSKELQKAYKKALGIIGLSDCLQYSNADEALIRGQWKIIQQAGYSN